MTWPVSSASSMDATCKLPGTRWDGGPGRWLLTRLLSLKLLRSFSSNMSFLWSWMMPLIAVGGCWDNLRRDGSWEIKGQKKDMIFYQTIQPKATTWRGHPTFWVVNKWVISYNPITHGITPAIGDTSGCVSALRHRVAVRHSFAMVNVAGISAVTGCDQDDGWLGFISATEVSGFI